MQPNRLTADEVRHLMTLVGDDNEDQRAVLLFIAHYYSADDLFQIPRHIYKEIIQRPRDFVQAARQFANPELPL